MSNEILFLCHHKDTWNSNQKLAGALRFAKTRGWEVVPLAPGLSRPENVKALLEQWRPIGCIVDRAGNDPDLPRRLFGRVPAVYLDPPAAVRWRGAAAVTCDNAAVSARAYAELSAALPRAFAAVPSPAFLPWSRERIAVFKALCETDGKPCAVFPGRRDEPHEERVARIAAWLRPLPKHTALFATNDNAALDVAEAARKIARHIPKELIVLGVDGMHGEEMPETRARFSSIILDVEYAGYAAARLLDDCPDKATNRNANTHFGPLSILRRDSTGGWGRRERRILEAVETIRREAADGLTAEALAARFPEMSRKHFERRFREATGRSVLDEILHVRFEKVLELLFHPNPPIEAIPDFCGFGSLRELQKLFKKRYGVSMKNWRKERGK